MHPPEGGSQGLCILFMEGENQGIAGGGCLQGCSKPAAVLGRKLRPPTAPPLYRCPAAAMSGGKDRQNGIAYRRRSPAPHQARVPWSYAGLMQGIPWTQVGPCASPQQLMCRAGGSHSLSLVCQVEVEELKEDSPFLSTSAPSQLGARQVEKSATWGLQLW